MELMTQPGLFRKNAILVEQDPIQYRLYCDVLNANGFDVCGTKSIVETLEKIREKTYDVMVINTEISEESFLEKVIKKIKDEKHSNLMPIVGISIHKEQKKIKKILDALLTKPLSIDIFIECVCNNVEMKGNGCEDSRS